ncbi:hypothetical protein KUCAC02_012192, partial [Chaenocephalus aceratus]
PRWLQRNFFQLTSLPPAQSLSTRDTTATEYGAASSARLPVDEPALKGEIAEKHLCESQHSCADGARKTLNLLQRDKLCCGSGNCHRELSCRRGEQWRAVSGGIVQRFNSPLRRLELNVYKWRRTRGARQLLHAGIIMAISKLK